MALEYPDLLSSESVLLPTARSRPLGRALCLFIPVTARRGLSRALLQHLAAEMADLDFTLDRRARADSVWVCGYGPGVEGLVAEIRRAYPEATLLVTGREAGDEWKDRVLAAGADHAVDWPQPYGLLARILGGMEPCSEFAVS